MERQPRAQDDHVRVGCHCGAFALRSHAGLFLARGDYDGFGDGGASGLLVVDILDYHRRRAARQRWTRYRFWRIHGQYGRRLDPAGDRRRLGGGVGFHAPVYLCCSVLFARFGLAALAPATYPARRESRHNRRMMAREETFL